MRGTAELSSSQSREFVVRSRPIEILPEAGAEAGQVAGTGDSPDAATFARGADISLLQQMEDSGVVYTENGQAKDPLAIFRNHGFNYMRLRLFHTPSGKGAQVNDLPYTLRLAQRIKASGFKLLLNFHYSDTWADPGHQRLPAVWQGMSHEQLVNQVFEYTRTVIEQFAEHDCLPDMVQIGNEIGGGMLWDDGRLGSPAQWSKFADLVKAGARGVRAGAGEGRPVEIMVHIARGGDKRACAWFFDNLLAQGVAFDVIGLSYYPFWHGTLDDLRENLESLARRYDKGVIVVETGCNWGEGWDAVAGSDSPDPPTPEGQRVFVEALIRTAKAAPNGRGVFYWAPEWIRDGGPWHKRALFDETGEVLPGMQAFQEQPRAAPLTQEVGNTRDPQTSWRCR